MDTNRQRSFLRRFLTPAAALVCIFLVAPASSQASEAEADSSSINVIEMTSPPMEDAPVVAPSNFLGALTPPPPPSPPDSFIMGLTSNRYLGATYNQLTNAGPESLHVGVSTASQQVTTQVGVLLYLQRWNGGVWENVGARNAISAGMVNLNYTAPATPGYYYRTLCNHWAENGGAREVRTSYSKSVLLPLS